MLKYHDHIECELFPHLGLADYGHSFGAIDLSYGPRALIQIPQSIGCSDGYIQPMYFVSHRKTQLFMSISHPRPIHIPILKEQTEDSNKEYIQTGLDKCDLGLHYRDLPVLTAVILKLNDTTEIECSNKEVMAEIRYSKDNLGPILHAKPVVSWWERPKSKWSFDCQCETRLEGDEYIAECTHLTDFTLLVDGRLGDPALCDPVLDFVGNILVIFSTMGLFCMSLVQYINL
jgi:hypothetical protein